MYDIESISADAFLAQIVELYQSEALAALRVLRTHNNNPPFTPSEFTLDPTAKGLPQLAVLAEQHRRLL